MRTKNTIFNTLWARVIETLNKVGPVAWDQRLSQIVNDAELPPLYPFKRLPNVKDFKIKWLSPYDPILLKAGIHKRVDEATFESTPYRNHRMNRYVHHQFTRLNASRGNPEKFWIIATHLLFRSHSYQTMSVNHVFPQWHRKYKQSVIQNILISMKDLVLTKYKYSTKFITKANGEARPLGVPKPGWRVLLHGLNNILLVWFSAYTHPSQHGFIPGKGTLTAWRELSEMLTSRHIYEFDLRKFFDSINLCYLSRILTITGIPNNIVSHIIKWNQTLPTRSPRHGITWLTPLDEASDYKYSKIGIPLFGFTDYEYWINRKRNEEKDNPQIRHYEYYRGVSQGMPTSPLLSTLILAPQLLREEGIVLYADDGVIISNSDPVKTPFFPDETGIRLNYDKSKTVKKDGVWLSPLKFLGLTYTYDPTSPTDVLVSGGTLSTSTRTPKKFTLDHLDLMRSAGYYHNYTGGLESTYDFWLQQKLAGYLQARLYAGGYDESTVLQDFIYNYKPFSWSDLERIRQGTQGQGTYRLNSETNPPDLTIFNSSSYANQSLSRWLKWRCPFGKTW